jgi:hypothetical protein
MQTAREMQLNLEVVDSLKDAGLFVTSKNYYRRKPQKVRDATAAGELALRNAASAGIVKYLPGDPAFTVQKPEVLNPAQKVGLARIEPS